MPRSTRARSVLEGERCWEYRLHPPHLPRRDPVPLASKRKCPADSLARSRRAEEVCRSRSRCASRGLHSEPGRACSAPELAAPTSTPSGTTSTQSRRRIAGLSRRTHNQTRSWDLSRGESSMLRAMCCHSRRSRLEARVRVLQRLPRGGRVRRVPSVEPCRTSASQRRAKSVRMRSRRPSSEVEW